ncbi:MAG TPA: polysaccharide deacetylase family protein [Acidimicrobiales bacterium]|nr:polysaccharide deacetylase family protein [Acidimicrobiales bacterium]
MTVCLTVDVEDWYDGMAEVGHVLPAPPLPPSGLEALGALLAGAPAARLTLFVVGKYCATVAGELRALAADGHEVASHGPDHGTPPQGAAELEDWLRRGREMAEEVVQRPVTGFRSPRFRIPAVGLERYREILAQAGYRYVSDCHRVGPGSPVKELPVFRWRGVPLGGGSYQRLLPKAGITPFLAGRKEPAVLYYHSYDFGVPLPSPLASRSPAVLKQVLGRRRIPGVVRRLLSDHGSVTCSEVTNDV